MAVKNSHESRPRIILVPKNFADQMCPALQKPGHVQGLVYALGAEEDPCKANKGKGYKHWYNSAIVTAARTNHGLCLLFIACSLIYSVFPHVFLFPGFFNDYGGSV